MRLTSTDLVKMTQLYPVPADKMCYFAKIDLIVENC